MEASPELSVRRRAEGRQWHQPWGFIWKVSLPESRVTVIRVIIYASSGTHWASYLRRTSWDCCLITFYFEKVQLIEEFHEQYQELPVALHADSSLFNICRAWLAVSPLFPHVCFYQPWERVGHDAPTPLPCEFLKNETSSYTSESNCQSQKMWTSSTGFVWPAVSVQFPLVRLTRPLQPPAQASPCPAPWPVSPPVRSSSTAGYAAVRTRAGRSLSRPFLEWPRWWFLVRCRWWVFAPASQGCCPSPELTLLPARLGEVFRGEEPLLVASVLAAPARLFVPEARGCRAPATQMVMSSRWRRLTGGLLGGADRACPVKTCNCSAFSAFPPVLCVDVHGLSHGADPAPPCGPDGTCQPACRVALQCPGSSAGPDRAFFSCQGSFPVVIFHTPKI